MVVLHLVGQSWGLAVSEIVSARDANHHFARILREVETGRQFVVTRNGVPIARIIPERVADGGRRLTQAQEQALQESLAWLRRGWPLGIDRIDRDSLYDETRGERGAR